MIQVKINEGEAAGVEIENGVFKMNGIEFMPDIVKISPTEYHLLLNNKGYRMVLSGEAGAKEFGLEVNGNLYNIAIKDKFDLLLDKLGMDFKPGLQAKEIKAPMPGLVIDILVKPGAEVEKDTPLIILEAMKMENAIKAPGAGIVDKIHVNPKEAVDKGQVLVSFK
jgi:biotin carboxyl carrier protein